MNIKLERLAGKVKEAAAQFGCLNVAELLEAADLLLAASKAEVETVAWRTFDGEGGHDFRDFEMNEDYQTAWNTHNPKHAGWVDALCLDKTAAVLKARLDSLEKQLEEAATDEQVDRVIELVDAFYQAFYKDAATQEYEALRQELRGGANMHALDKAQRSLKAAGFVDCGGKLWKPPLGRVPAEFCKGVYVASRASLPGRAAMWLRLKNIVGWQINSSWIYEAGEGQTDDFQELWERITDEIASSRGLIFYAEGGDFPLKGALVEVGIAIGMGRRVQVVLDNVVLSHQNMRPVGSWLEHPLVQRSPDLKHAYATLVGPLA